MKTLTQTKRHAVGKSRKSAPRVSHTAVRGRDVSRSEVRSRHSDTKGPARRGAINAGHQGVISPSPQARQTDHLYQAAIKDFEAGVRAFQKRDYSKAAEIFAELVDCAAREVADRAKMHLRLCRQRTSRTAPPPKSAEDYYTLGVAYLNDGQSVLAIDYLSKADKIRPQQDHVQYALAVSHTLAGNRDAAMVHLESAVALRPENRIHARREEDFQGLAGDPRFRRLVHSAGS